MKAAFFAALGAAGINVSVVLSLMGFFALLVVATGCFLRWYVHLTPARRADVLALIRAVRRR